MEKESLLAKLQDEIFQLLKYDIEGLTKFYNIHIKFFGLADFYDKLLKPILYKIDGFGKKVY